MFCPARGRTEIDLSIEIEATSLCNTHCIHCPREAITRSSGHMTLPVYEAVIANILAVGFEGVVNFSGLGEPTLNPLLPKFISLLSDGWVSYITTNGSRLNRARVDKLLDAGLKNVFISFNGADAETFARMSGGLDFEQVKRQTAYLVERAGDRAHVIANVSMTGINRGSAAAIRECLESIGVTNCIFSKSHSRGGRLLDKDIDSTPVPPIPTRRCDIFAQTLFVASNGDVLSCCHDVTGETKFGNLAEEPLYPILERKISMIMRGGQDFRICDECNDLYRFMQEPLPDGRPLFAWVYDLCVGDAACLEGLGETLQRSRRAREESGLGPGELEAWLELLVASRS